MNVEWVNSVASRARVHAALGEPARLAIVDRLVLGDASPGELGQALGIATNLLAHHVNVLQEAGVIERCRSEGDRRRTYLRLLPAALTGLMPGALLRAPRVLFVCTHNAARSQFAAALWARRSQVPAAAAGTRPAARVHPRAVAAARRHDLVLNKARTAHIDDVFRPGDLVIAVCDNAHEQLGAQAADRLHWSVPDPVRAGTADAFEAALNDITGRVERLIPAIHPTTGAPDDHAELQP